MKRVVAGVVVLVVVGLLVWRFSSRERATKQVAESAVQASGAPARAGSSSARADRAPPAWFATRGAEPRRIAGRVTLKGAPVENALVTLQSTLTRADAAAIVELRTGRDGAFDFGVQPPARYEIAASSEAKAGAIARIDLADPTLVPPADRLELRLQDCAAFVEGTVVDAEGNPVPKTSVRRDGLVGTTSDARGAYKLCVPWGEHAIDYSADGYGAVTLTIEVRGEMHRDVTLVPEATIDVRAVGVTDGTFIADAHVSAWPAQWGPDRPRPATGITDAEGRVRLVGLVPGRYRIGGWADGMQAQDQAEALAQVGVAVDVVLRFEATAQIIGKVISNGAPVAGARVGAVRKAPLGRAAQAVSQRDGSFVLERVPVGELLLTAAPHEVISPVPFAASAATTYKDVIIDVRALGKIRGRVTRLGKPVENVEVCCLRTAASMDPRARTDAAGNYEFAGVPAGTYSLGAGDEEVGAFTHGGKVTLGPGEEKVLDLELDMAGTIAGTVVDRDGRPVRGVFVRWVNEKTNDIGRSVTDSQGRYRCSAMTGGGKYRAAVFPAAELQQVPYPTADGLPYPTLDVKDGSTVIENVELAIERPDLSIRGRVVDDANGAVSDAVVKALPSTGGPPRFVPWQRLPMTSTDTDGKFVLANLAPGSHALSARAADGAEGIAPSIAAGATDATIRIERAAAVEGKLVGFKQPPSVYARAIGASFAHTSGVVDSGASTFRVTGLRPGRYLVSAQTTYEGDAHEVELRAGETAKLTMTSRGRGTVEGTVLDFRTRTPLANAMCHAVMSSGGEQSTTNWDPTVAAKSDARGRVLLDPAPAGSIAVACEMSAFRWSPPSASLTLSPNSRATVELLSVELSEENPSSIGIAFNWQTTAPRIAIVESNSPGAKAGLLVGDLVTDVNDLSVRGLNGAGVQRLINSTPIGHDVRLRVLRGTVVKTVTARSVPD